MPRSLASRTRRWAHSRTCTTEPGAEPELGVEHGLDGVDHDGRWPGPRRWPRRRRAAPSRPAATAGARARRAARPGPAPAACSPRPTRRAPPRRPRPAAPSACSSNVDLPMPGSPPSRVTEPGTRPPPRTRSSSATPVGRGRALGGVDLEDRRRPVGRPVARRAGPRPGGAPRPPPRGCSTPPHVGQRPPTSGRPTPQSVQRWVVRRRAMAATLRRGCATVRRVSHRGAGTTGRGRAAPLPPSTCRGRTTAVARSTDGVRVGRCWPAVARPTPVATGPAWLLLGALVGLVAGAVAAALAAARRTDVGLRPLRRRDERRPTSSSRRCSRPGPELPAPAELRRAAAGAWTGSPSAVPFGYQCRGRLARRGRQRRRRSRATTTATPVPGHRAARDQPGRSLRHRRQPRAHSSTAGPPPPPRGRGRRAALARRRRACRSATDSSSVNHDCESRRRTRRPPSRSTIVGTEHDARARCAPERGFYVRRRARRRRRWQSTARGLGYASSTPLVAARLEPGGSRSRASARAAADAGLAPRRPPMDGRALEFEVEARDRAPRRSERGLDARR